MKLDSDGSTNIVRFRNAHTSDARKRDQKSFMDAVYMAGTLPVAADDEATKRLAVRLTIFGFVMIDEILTDGSARRLRPSEALHSDGASPWLVSKPSTQPVGQVSLIVGGRHDWPTPIIA